MRCLCVSVIILIILIKWSTTVNSQLKQERATIDICNTKYVTDCYAITRRLKRGGSYKTNLTMQTRYQNDNNVTMRVVLFDTIPVELVKIRLCEISKIDWLYDFIIKHSNINGIFCPTQAGLYAFYNLEFPPKNFPRKLMSLLQGKFYGKFYFLVTNTEEIIIECTIRFHALQ